VLWLTSIPLSTGREPLWTYICEVPYAIEDHLLDLSKLVGEPFVVTFTAHLPFPVGIPNELGHTIFLGSPFKDPADTTHFGPRPFVNIRVFEVVEQGLPVWQQGTHSAIEHFYGASLDGDSGARYGEDQFMEHDQWVTLETPHAPVEGEDPVADRGFTFHRCLNMFNMFLQAALYLTGDIRIRQMSSHDLRPVVVIGALAKGREWRSLADMYMHPEARPAGLLTTDKPFSQDEFNSGLHAIVTGKPYLRTITWRSRAQRALRQTGDAADAIISFQVAAESLLFDTYRMLLVDEGCPSADISSQLTGEIPFKSLLTRKLPAKLGGQWDVTRGGTAVAEYWTNLYRIRNSVVHAGLQVHTGHAEEAQKAYWGLRDHMESRLWANRNSYPRTLLARIGEKQLAERGWLTNSIRRLLDDIKNGPQPYYWPHDLRTQDDMKSE
jgi:hypothetical protein